MHARQHPVQIVVGQQAVREPGIERWTMLPEPADLRRRVARHHRVAADRDAALAPADGRRDLVCFFLCRRVAPELDGNQHARRRRRAPRGRAADPRRRSPAPTRAARPAPGSGIAGAPRTTTTPAARPCRARRGRDRAARKSRLQPGATRSRRRALSGSACRRRCRERFSTSRSMRSPTPAGRRRQD